MTNPGIFIVGCPGSGTTLLLHFLWARPQIAITPEPHWIPLWFEQRRGLTPDGDVTRDLIEELLVHPKFALFRLGRNEVTSVLRTGQPMSYAAFVTGLFDLYGTARGKKLVGNKTPD